MASISTLLTPLPVFLITLVIVIVSVITLKLVEKRLKRKLSFKEGEKITFNDKVNSLNELKNNPQEFLISLDKISREFFHEAFSTDTERNYSNLIETFKKRGNDKAAHFCEMMQKAIYSGERIDKKKSGSMLKSFNSLMDFYDFEKHMAAKKKAEKESQRITLFGIKLNPFTKGDVTKTPPLKTETPNLETPPVKTENPNIRTPSITTIQQETHTELETKKEPVLEAEPKKEPTINIADREIVGIAEVETPLTQEKYKTELTFKKDETVSAFKKNVLKGIKNFFNIPKKITTKTQLPKYEEAKITKAFFIKTKPQKSPIKEIKKIKIKKENIFQWTIRKIKRKKIPAVIKIIPIKKEKISPIKVRHFKREPHSYKFIESLDNLDRVKKRIENRRKLFAFDEIREETGLV